MNYLEKGKCSQTEKAMHTHDLISFKDCRRKWQWSSPFGLHLQPKPTVSYDENGNQITNVNQHLWYGSAMHFALEDFEGSKKFASITEAFDAFVEAHLMEERPSNWEELVDVGHKLFDFLGPWLEENKDWKVVWQDGKPLTEVKFSLILSPLCHYKKVYKDGHIEVMFPAEDSPGYYATDDGYSRPEVLEENGWEYVEIVAHGTFDAIVEDEYGNWYVLDYKSAKAFDVDKLALDQQVSFYSWAASQYFQKPVEGFVYVQITKNPPHAPTITKTGVSTAKTQRTTKKLYMETCIAEYGDNIPAKNLEFYETIDESNFVNVQWVERTQIHQENFYKQIIQQGLELLNPNLPIYPNPTMDCKWKCPFRTVCIAQEEGADWQYLLTEMFEERVETLTDDFKAWEKRLFMKYPDKFPEEYQVVLAEKQVGATLSEEQELKLYLEGER